MEYEKLYHEISGLLPSQLEIAKKIIEGLLDTKNNNRLTNLEYQAKYKDIKCPFCNGERYKKNGHKNGTQRYWCKKCHKSFSITTNTVLQSSKISYKQLKTIIKGLLDLNPINTIAKDSNLSQTEVYNLEIKIFTVIDGIFHDIKLKEIVEVDEKYFRVSFKGTKKEKMPRKSRKSGSQNLTPGISNDQICVIVAIDSFDNMIIQVAGLGPASTEMIDNVLSGKIEENSIIVTDSKSSYIKFAQNHNLNLKQIPTGEHSIEKYSLGELNSLMSEIETYVTHLKRGLSSKHLQQHLDFIKYRKILNYTYEYIEKNENMLKEIVISTSNLRCRKVCDFPLPFDLDEYVHWWNTHSYCP